MVGVQFTILGTVILFDVKDLNNANGHRAGGCEARDTRNCPRFFCLGGAVLVTVIIFDAYSHKELGGAILVTVVVFEFEDLKCASSHRDCGYPGQNSPAGSRLA